MKWRGGEGDDAGQAPPAVYDNILDFETPLCWKTGLLNPENDSMIG